MAGYIGSKSSVVNSGVENKKVITATAGQTSFTGLTYSPNRVHVFQNGVRLVDGTDYTATNGNSLTLTVGALADDQVVVVSYSGFQTSDTVSSSAGGTFTGDVNFTGAFTSQGIDDNATSTAMTLDGSGNLLVGKTSSDATVSGCELRPAGRASFTATNDFPLQLRRYTSDGDIIQFRKEGTTLGSIASVGGANLAIGTGDTGIRFVDSNDQIYPYNMSTGANRDALIDVGTSGARFKDLYLSGGVVFGDAGGSGNVTSNTLDDYEEGTFQPVIADNSSGGNTSTTGQGHYTKIGRVVVVNVDITNIDTTGLTAENPVYVQGLPFANNGAVRSTSTLQVNLVNNGVGLFAHLSENGTQFTFKYNDNSKNNPATGLKVSDINDDQADMFGITLVYQTSS